MSRYLIFLSALRVAFADYSPWDPVDATVTQVVSRTAYVCPCDGSTSYGPNFNAWEGKMSGVTGSGSKTTAEAKTTSTRKTDSYSPKYTEPSGSSTRCYTRMGTDSALYGTTWSTSYTSCTSTITSTINTTTTLPASTTILTSTITTTVTGPTNTQTGTVTVTTTNTDTTTSTVTATSTTSTVSTSTSTVGTTSGFIPIRSSVPGSSNSGSGGAVPLAKRDENARSTFNYNQTSPLGNFRFVHGVDCVHWTASQCSSISTTITSTQTVPASTVTSTQTVTVTSTVFPSATTTVTSTATTTTVLTDTATTTTTTTSTSIVPGPTLYAACAANNLADTVNGQVIGNNAPSAGRQTTVTSTTANSAYDCCVAGLSVTNAAVALFAPDLGNGCYMGIQDNCISQATNPYSVTLGDQGFGQVTLSNLLCGENIS